MSRYMKSSAHCPGKTDGEHCLLILRECMCMIKNQAVQKYAIRVIYIIMTTKEDSGYFFVIV